MTSFTPSIKNFLATYYSKWLKGKRIEVYEKGSQHLSRKFDYQDHEFKVNDLMEDLVSKKLEERWKRLKKISLVFTFKNSRLLSPQVSDGIAEMIRKELLEKVEDE
ncbi:MAG: hypothetical protein NZ895_02095 [Archaeoglobaceae archaeon]|nr:hypothetical protein [Archaeoglobaceae archaeon]MCX8152151.1 hypothetical protein [Archaeoglobaceae archaeon]MDW8013867.1 hypothetical protein [Archaeoglobaceae archaeon]